MENIWKVTKFEVVRQLKKPSFWIALLALPILMVGMSGLSILSSNSLSNNIASQKDKVEDVKLGITDKANLISDSLYNEKIKKIADKETGISAVKNGEIDEYFYIADNFLQEKVIEEYTKERENESLVAGSGSGNIKNLLGASVGSRVSPSDITILTNSYKINTTKFDKKGNKANPMGRAVVPIIVLAIFYLLVCVFGNKMLMAVVEEKENRISEMILTAVSARDLIIGKIIALILLGFLQMSVFLIPSVLLLYLNRENPMISNVIGMIEFEPIPLIMNIVLLLFSYFMYTGASTLVGALVPTAREASQYIGIVIMGVMIPFFFISSVITAEPNFMTYILSYFPLSAPIALMLRNAFGFLPWYEFLIGIVEIGLFAGLVVYLSAKYFQKNAITFSLTKISFKPRLSWKKYR